MTRKSSEASFVDAVRQVLDEEVENLDASTRARLNRIRQTAMETGLRRPRMGLQGGMRWLAGAAVAAALAVGIYFNTGSGSVDMVSQTSEEDFDIIALEEPLEFIDDIEFYAWLAEMGDGSV